MKQILAKAEAIPKSFLIAILSSQDLTELKMMLIQLSITFYIMYMVYVIAEEKYKDYNKQDFLKPQECPIVNTAI